MLRMVPTNNSQFYDRNHHCTSVSVIKLHMMFTLLELLITEFILYTA